MMKIDESRPLAFFCYIFGDILVDRGKRSHRPHADSLLGLLRHCPINYASVSPELITISQSQQ